MVRDSESQICPGREFQSLGDVLEKALSPRLWSFDVWVERRPAEEDLRARGVGRGREDQRDMGGPYGGELCR